MSSGPYELGCIAFQGIYERSVVDPVGAAVSFFIFFIIGIIIAIILIKFCGTGWFGDKVGYSVFWIQERLRSQGHSNPLYVISNPLLSLRKFKKPTDEEAQLASPLTTAEDPDAIAKKPAKRRGRRLPLWKRRKNSVDVDNEGPKAPLVPPILTVLELDDPAKTVVRDTKTMADAIMQKTEAAGDGELLTQDLASTEETERRGRIVHLLVMAMLERLQVNKLLEAGRVDGESHAVVVQGIDDGARNARDQLDLKAKIIEEEIRIDPKLMEDEALMRKRLDQLPIKINTILSEVMLGERSRYKSSLAIIGGLSEDETGILLTALANNLASFEEGLATEQTRQLSNLNDRLAQRRELLAAAHNQSSMDRKEVTGRIEARGSQLDGLVIDKGLNEGAKQDLLAKYLAELKAAQEAHETSLAEQRAVLADKLINHRAEKMQELEKRQMETRVAFFNKQTQATSGSEFITKYQGMLTKQQAEVATVTDQLDKEDYAMMDKLRQEHLHSRGVQMTVAEANLMEGLKTALPAMTQEEANRIIAEHERRMNQWRRDQKAERRGHLEGLQTRLDRLKRQREDDHLAGAEEQLALEDQQRSVLTKAIGLNLDLDEAAKNRIMAEHRANVARLSNQAQFNRARQNKMLESRLVARRVQIAEIESEKETAIADALQRRVADTQALQTELDAKIAAEEETLKAERKANLVELHETLTGETQQALANQEQQLSALIGRLQVGQARRQKVLANQEKLLTDLESKLERTVFAEERQGKVSMTALDQLLQKHRNSVSVLTDRQQDARLKQEETISHQLNRMKRDRERDLDTKMDSEANETMTRIESIGVSNVTQILVENSLSQRHERAIQALEQEFRVEMQRQKEGLIHEQEEELQTMLQNQRKNFLVQLAGISHLTKKEIDAVVTSTATGAGLDNKSARSLAKDFKGEVGRHGSYDDDDEEDSTRKPNNRRPSSSGRPGSAGRDSSQNGGGDRGGKPAKKLSISRRPSARPSVPHIIHEEDEDDF